MFVPTVKMMKTNSFMMMSIGAGMMFGGMAMMVMGMKRIMQ